MHGVRFSTGYHCGWVGIGATLLVLGGCSFNNTVGGGFDPTGDGPPAMQRDGSQMGDLLCFGGAYQVCVPAAPTAPLTLATQTIDTGTDPRCTIVPQPSGPALCVIAGTMVDVPTGATVTGVGTRPLVLLATQTLTIGGTIDVASRRSPMRIGAGGDAAECTEGTSPGNGDGGSGGSFKGKGGNGGGNGGSMSSAGLTSAPVVLRGGCAGTNGGSPGAVRGHGGGVVYLLAGGQIVLTGATINASGSGAFGTTSGQANGGGGGAGSGGMIVLHGASIAATASLLFANGGGGGEGGDGDGDGNDGSDPATPATAATGGSGAGSGGDGGTGSALITLDGGVGGSGGGSGGGGGGGGAGFILSTPALGAGAQTSPPPG